ncbi:hypothetical protein C0081_13215 [Cohaesibacter celericrescens]|uniref:Uncharacterized protein n=2 Tax=Cohaesibacter celericrescens TaxID=2067669 RepID=A0A2N5XRF1_9HYPH|nr:hypothetical protein C0081_13215 [Cohaesibacter celericrescens]
MDLAPLSTYPDHPDTNCQEHMVAKRSLFSFLILSIFMATLSAPVVLLPNSVSAMERTNPKASKCLALAKQIGASNVWWGRHVGSKELDPLFKWGPSKEVFNSIGCFKTRKECEDWLYWKRTDYPEFSSVRPCRRGL